VRKHLRILFVNYEYPPIGGGGGVVNAWLAEELAKRHETTVLTSRAFDLPERENKQGVEVIRSRTFFRRQKPAANLPSMASFVLSGALKGCRLVRNRPFDIINTHFAVPTGPVGSIMSWYGGIPNVLSVHGGDLYDPSKSSSPHRHAVLRYVIRKLARSADAIVGQSKNTNDNLLQYFDPMAKPGLIPLGIPRPSAVSSGRDALGMDANETVLISVGRLVARKRVDQLVTLVSSLQDKAVRLIVIGDGPEGGALKSLAHELGVSDQITFAGFVTDQQKVDYLAAADIYVSTSQHEGFGLVFIEAMAQGLPVVCYDHGGQTDFLQTGVNGSVLTLNDFDGLVASSRDLIADPDKRQIMSGQNRQDVEKYFIENCARRYEALFSQVIARGR